MNLEITEQERDLLLDLIESAERSAILGIDHSDTRDYKELLRNRLDLLASAMNKLQNDRAQAA